MKKKFKQIIVSLKGEYICTLTVSESLAQGGIDKKIIEWLENNIEWDEA